MHSVDPGIFATRRPELELPSGILPRLDPRQGFGEGNRGLFGAPKMGQRCPIQGWHSCILYNVLHHGTNAVIKSGERRNLGGGRWHRSDDHSGGPQVEAVIFTDLIPVLGRVGKKWIAPSRDASKGNGPQ